MNTSELFESKYLKKEEINMPTTAHIAGVSVEVLKSQGGDKRKGILHFTGGRLKPMVLNVMNSNVISGAYGNETDLWNGKPVEIFVDPNVMMGTQRVGGLRIRIPSANYTGNAPSGHTPAGPPIMNLAMALAALQSVNLTKDDLKRVITSKGFTGYMPDRDTKTVYEMISEAKENAAKANGSGQEESFGGPADGEEIPFAFWLGLIGLGLSMASTLA